ncbi:DUF4097 family beta strand repeat-containing protein [Allonocardiopsis opalescens]|uniref:DUF4097 domain-containing protein n=1 Tax=Allonocardiopsis opalescens TaxID=1144618 RepID=A0A2T0QAQ9_9ACTN|nr:hypothetical protein [Allonocardiopsis opalescens]PRY00959.1 hypothetical protein CLV72_102592 [Allonocardiopsis opalescens]
MATAPAAEPGPEDEAEPLVSRRGRRVWIAAGAVLTTALLAASAPGLLTEALSAALPPVRLSGAYSGVERVVLGHSEGDYRVVGVPGDQVLVERLRSEVFGRAVDEPVQDGGSLELGGGCLGVDDCRTDFVVRVPYGTEVEAAATHSDIRIEDVRGAVDLLTGGEVAVAGGVGALRTTTQDDVVLDGVRADDIDVRIVGSGDLSVRATAPALRGFVRGGEVSLHGSGLEEVDVETRGGDVAVGFAERPRDLRVSTFGGSVAAELPGGAPYRLDVETGSGDRVIEVDRAERGPLVWLRTGGGDAVVREVRTTGASAGGPQNRSGITR